ncbi:MULTISPECIES: GNAT family N-acetyltransferase [unclassified Luteococcus]|uniref:GNAT family N-acetyltransferase n=1 Tax=unclassified Luteococcus TaxID=2639923 RepID=UPI00313DC1A0
MASPPRVSLRRVTPDGVASDLVGELVRADQQEVVLLPAGRGPVTIPRSQIRALRRVPARVVRPSSRTDDLQRVMAQGWPGIRTVRMGGWSLHLGEGYSRRANSCHPTGDPERELGIAIDQVAAFYAQHALTPCFLLAARDRRADEPAVALDAALAERGWLVRTPSRVMVRDLREPLEPQPVRLHWHDEPDGTWLGLEPSDHPGRLAVLSSAPAHYATLHLDGQPVGCGRLVITDDWAGLSCLFVTPAARGAGHGSALAIAMMARAHELGARFCYLQLADDNDSAQRLYQSLGFVVHHRYHYRELVG